MEFRCRCDGIRLDTDAIDFEDFLGFLDTEFYLGLRGSDTWSDEGNPTQLLVKRLIAKILMERTPVATALDDLYLQFADGLQPGDLVLTFNYDIVLERALEAVGKPFRLFDQRLRRVRGSYAEIDSSRDEVVVLKLHGSVDWFHRGQYRQRCESIAEYGLSTAPNDPVFNSDVLAYNLSSTARDIRMILCLRCSAYATSKRYSLSNRFSVPLRGC